jgi:hypothetical protein
MVVSHRHREWIGHRVDDQHGARIGTVKEVLVDPETTLTWLVVAMGRFTRRITLVPVRDLVPGDSRLWMPIERDVVTSAPRATTDDAWLRGSFRSLLYRHYGLVGLPRNRGASASVS